MAEIDRFRPDDRRGVETLYRRTHGADAVVAQNLRWDWQHRRNPANTGGQPSIWVAHEGPTVVGHFPTLPVRLSLRGMNVEAAWGSEAYVAPERESLALDEALVRAWDRNTGAALTMGISEGTRVLFDRIHWPPATVVPCLVKPLTRRALRLPNVPLLINRLVSALTLPVIRVVARSRPLRAECEPIRRFDQSFTALWERIAPQFDLAVGRDAAYLNCALSIRRTSAIRWWRSSVKGKCTGMPCTVTVRNRSARSPCSSTCWWRRMTIPASRRSCGG